MADIYLPDECAVAKYPKKMFQMLRFVIQFIILSIVGITNVKQIN